MRDRTNLLILFFLIALFFGLRWREVVTSRIRYDYPMEGTPPPWTGQVGDVVTWNGVLWGWTDAPAQGFRGWARIGPSEQIALD